MPTQSVTADSVSSPVSRPSRPTQRTHWSERQLLRRLSIFTGLVAIVTSLGIATPQLANADDTIVLDRHHTDAVSVRWEDSALVLRTRADLETGAGTMLDPTRVRFHLTDRQHGTVPDVPGFEFLGEPGDDIWTIPQRYESGSLWAGWETETLPRGLFVNDTITLSLTEVTGPGDLEVFVNDISGPERLLSSRDSMLRSFTEHVGAHTHANWVFTAPGEYTLTFVASAHLAQGGQIASLPQRYAFTVGGDSPLTPNPPDAQDPDPDTDPAPPHTAPGPQTPPSDGTPPAPATTHTPPAAASTNPPATATTTEEECIATPVTQTISPGDVTIGSDGHFDFGPVLEGGELKPRVKDDRLSPAQWVDPATLVFHLGAKAAQQAPGGAFDFLGTGTIWQIPLTQEAGVPWLGWNTQHPSIAGHTQGPITLTLDALDGPGHLAVYSVNSWGQPADRFFGTLDGFPRSTEITVGGSGVHVHGIWAFTEPGIYVATMTFSGTVDGAHRSGSTTLTFAVGDVDPQTAAKERQVTTYVGRTASGEPCELTLATTGLTSEESKDLGGLAWMLLVLGAAFVGASALRPRHQPVKTT